MDQLPQQDLRVANELSAFFIAAAVEGVDRGPVLDAPADGEAHRGAHASTRPSCRAARSPRRRLASWASSTRSSAARRSSRGRRPTACSRCRRRTSRSTTGHRITTKGVAAIVFQPLATADFESIVAEMEELLASTGEDTGTTITTSDDEHGYRWMILRDDDLEDLVVGINAVSDALDGRRLRRPRPRRRLRVQGLQGPARLLHLQLQARLLVPVRPGRARTRATASASCRSARSSTASCRSSPSSSAGSRSGASRSSRRRLVQAVAEVAWRPAERALRRAALAGPWSAGSRPP